MLVWRKQFGVFHRPGVEDEERCLPALANAGITLGELAELLLKPDAGAERTSERFAALLEGWLHEGDGLDSQGFSRSQHFRLVSEGPLGGVPLSSAFQKAAAFLRMKSASAKRLKPVWSSRSCSRKVGNGSS